MVGLLDDDDDGAAVGLDWVLGVVEGAGFEAVEGWVLEGWDLEEAFEAAGFFAGVAWGFLVLELLGAEACFGVEVCFGAGACLGAGPC